MATIRDEQADLGYDYIYNPALLDELDSSQFLPKYALDVTIADPGEALRIRPLKRCDYHHGFLKILSQLTSVGEISEKEFHDQFDKMKACPNTYYVTVVEDLLTHDIIATGTLLIEWKFIHKCATRGRIEDVVVSLTYRGRQLGRLMIATLTILAEHLKCYKLSLDCKDHMLPFYTSLKFCQEPENANYLQLRFEEEKPK